MGIIIRKNEEGNFRTDVLNFQIANTTPWPSTTTPSVPITTTTSTTSTSTTSTSTTSTSTTTIPVWEYEDGCCFDCWCVSETENAIEAYCTKRRPYFCDFGVCYYGAWDGVNYCPPYLWNNPGASGASCYSSVGGSNEKSHHFIRSTCVKEV